MSWRPASKRDLPGVIDFLVKDEQTCVPFTSRLRAEARGCVVHIEEADDGGIAGCALISPYGLLLPVFSERGPDTDGLAEIINRSRVPIHSIMGLSRWVTEVERLIPLPPTTRIEYFLMTLPASLFLAGRRINGAAVEIRRASGADVEALFPLQMAYELEEVIINPSNFNQGQCLNSLKQSLREELVYMAEMRGEPVAKAATNARGYTVDQIGGVYTVPGQRGNGIARAVMIELLKEVFTCKSAATLFVKKRNAPAVALYDHMGFVPKNDYVISYYGI